MTAWALYSEIDPFAAAWLGKLIAAGHIMPGVVDTRSLEDLTPDECNEFRQVHLCAGIGVWSFALRCAGWADERPVWTASFPCQPFSAAGKGAGFADERHIWPAGHWLINECRPDVILGEQVASKDGLAWLDVVSSDLEGSGYAFGSADLCAAGVGAPHIRQRAYWMAHAEDFGRREQSSRVFSAPSPSIREVARQGHGDAARADSTTSRLAHTVPAGRTEGWAVAGVGSTAGSGQSGRMGDDDDTRLEGLDGYGYRGRQSGRVDTQPARSDRTASGTVRLADTHDAERRTVAQGWLHEQYGNDAGRQETASGLVVDGQDVRPGPTNGFWQDADWLGCTDDKWRPVEPGTFPLVDGAANRVGRLRGYGNAIVSTVAQTFIEAVMDCMP